MTPGAAVEQTDEAEGAADLPILSAEKMKEVYRGEGRVVLIAAQSSLDEAAALMLSQILGKHGLPTRVLAPEALSSAPLAALAQSEPALICLCYLGRQSGAHMRYALKRLRRRLPSTAIILASFSTEQSVANPADTALADQTETTLRGVSQACIELATLAVAS